MVYEKDHRKPYIILLGIISFRVIRSEIYGIVYEPYNLTVSFLGVLMEKFAVTFHCFGDKSKILGQRFLGIRFGFIDHIRFFLSLIPIFKISSDPLHVNHLVDEPIIVICSYSLVLQAYRLIKCQTPFF